MNTEGAKKMARPKEYIGTGEELEPVLKQMPKERFRLIRLTEETPVETYEETLAKATRRTSEQIAQARARVLDASPPPRTLPEGKTLEDMVLGQ